MISYQQVAGWPSARDYQAENVQNWLFRHATAIAAREEAFIRKDGDLIAPAAKTKSSVRMAVEKFPDLLDSRLFRARPKGIHVSSATTVYHSNTTLDAVSYAVVISLGLMLLIGPMWVLQFVADDVRRLGIITGFVLVFTALLASATVAKPFEVLAATAA